MADQNRTRHVVDTLIEERAPNLTGNSVLARLARAWLYPLLKYPEAVRLIDQAVSLDGREVMELAHTALRLQVALHGVENIPATGRLIVAANHPTGIADGVAVYEALKPVRPDMLFLANRDALRIAPGLADLVIPVDWVKAKRSVAGSREVLQRAYEAFREEKVVVTFPSGRIAYLTATGLRERDWLPTVINLARRVGAPILPLHIKARNSALFYAFSQISHELRDVTLFLELLNKRGKRFDLQFGRPIQPHDLDGDPVQAIARLQAFVESGFKGDIAGPADRPSPATA